MATKIEEAKRLRSEFKNNLNEAQLCLGNKYDRETSTYVKDSRNDKNDFSFSTHSHHSAQPIYLDAYCGYYGDSNVSFLNNGFYIQCMCKAINARLPELRKETEKSWKKSATRH